MYEWIIYLHTSEGRTEPFHGGVDYRRRGIFEGARDTLKIGMQEGILFPWDQISFTIDGIVCFVGTIIGFSNRGEFNQIGW